MFENSLTNDFEVKINYEEKFRLARYENPLIKSKSILRSLFELFLSVRINYKEKEVDTDLLFEAHVLPC